MAICTVCGMSYADNEIDDGICEDCWEDYESVGLEPIQKKRKFDDERQD